MCLISVPNLKEIHSREGWLKIIVLNWCKEEEKENQEIFRNIYLTNYLSDFLQIWYVVVYIEGIKYVKLIEIGPVVIEI